MAITIGVEFTAMACPCALRLVGADEAALRDAARRAIAEVRRIEARYSRYRDDSIVSAINARAGSGEPLAVDGETAALLDFAASLHRASGGAFDITSGVLRRAWDFNGQRLPTPGEVDALLPLVGWQQVAWDGTHITLPRAGMQIDFGGFGKEYAADRCAGVLAAAGVDGGFVELGGDICIIGPAADGSPWQLGIRHPRRPGATVGEVALRQGALATSGDYERFIEHGGRRYSHLLDARSGWPVGQWQSVSVVAPTCAAAGAVATLAMLLGAEAEPFLAAQGLSYLAVDIRGGVRHGGSKPPTPPAGGSHAI